MNKLILIILSQLFAFGLFAQDGKSGEENAQANNPLANFKALNIQNYYAPKITDAPEDAYLNTSWLRYAQPLSDGKFVFRISAPISTIGTPVQNGSIDSENGLGDINGFFSYNFVSKPTKTIGIGPLVTAPTATEDVLGSGKWQGGLAFVAFISNTPTFQFGSLVTWQASFAGDDGREKTNQALAQPFYFWQLGKGTYLRGAPNWVFDLQNSTYSIPFALGVGKVVKIDKTVFNLFVEPQYAMLHNGVQPQFQLYTGINMQFLK